MYVFIYTCIPLSIWILLSVCFGATSLIQMKATATAATPVQTGQSGDVIHTQPAYSKGSDIKKINKSTVKIQM